MFDKSITRLWVQQNPDRAVTTIRALQEREKLLIAKAEDDVGAWRTVSEHIRVLQQRNEDMRVNLDRACAQRDALQAREGRLREKAERAAAAYSGAASRADKASAKALSYKQEADDLRAKLDRFRKGVVDIAKQRNQAKAKLDEAVGLLKGWIGEHGHSLWGETRAFLSTLKPAEHPRSLCGGTGWIECDSCGGLGYKDNPHSYDVDTCGNCYQQGKSGHLPCPGPPTCSDPVHGQQECDGSGNVEFGSCPGCSKCRPCKKCRGTGEVYTSHKFDCTHCNATGVEPGEGEDGE